MKILITGSKGQLGNELQGIIKSGVAEIGKVSDFIKESEVISLDIDKLDITDLGQVVNKITDLKPDVVINCAAATNVDWCESNENFAFKVNSLGPRNLAIACEKISAKLVHISTDYVFSGEGDKPLKEYDLTAPCSVYGKTKLLGENYVRKFSTKYFIVRTAWLYGYVGSNFVYTMRKLAKERNIITVVNDQKGNPTNANDLAYHILKLIPTEEFGLYHCTGKGECTWYDFANMIIRLSQEECEVKPCISEEYKTKARRPKHSSLDNMMFRNTVGDEMRGWQEALKSFIYKLDK
ncbi:dTDP-4-dehydrorhamnose reductase [Clostridium saccharobutylicum]|uniref:dTDP-4-dehydrorhamnose reductase n=1 Tax=Clostridium saccharobutylicum DSM 13864 TaxID=1345695 RepID=U5MW01_CLOSA|nr:dTDP-4-dehydrorhamnose reductase [Clostridium saccharobutylicum]AGX43816.1 spore coat polysaccharide biosynthesis protein SpsK [Clostridium saccharobutylicum DSM 13864]AQR91116.1 dTDP-4-dehydrorhamnose reductase [Clostridium saccharobutylicum]AQS01020.1 dTDP-4-dehydrorhamnose reductase [Clostridium saccharobutylicum]AQS15003.1 dTDP-4-dehydrorhamnose reductase [Clostridium saccharobutylicum]MBA2905127.1 dTDP-4-dehydrorhamnose reductase [Clostridium saccharobutylicum]